MYKSLGKKESERSEGRKEKIGTQLQSKGL